MNWSSCFVEKLFIFASRPRPLKLDLSWTCHLRQCRFYTCTCIFIVSVALFWLSTFWMKSMAWSHRVTMYTTRHQGWPNSDATLCGASPLAFWVSFSLIALNYIICFAISIPSFDQSANCCIILQYNIIVWLKELRLLFRASDPITSHLFTCIQWFSVNMAGGISHDHSFKFPRRIFEKAINGSSETHSFRTLGHRNRQWSCQLVMQWMSVATLFVWTQREHRIASKRSR